MRISLYHVSSLPTPCPNSSVFGVILTFKLQAAYAEEIVGFITDLISQLPTRRYVHGLLQDLQIPSCIRLSPLFIKPHYASLRKLFKIFEHYFYVAEEDFSTVKPLMGEQYTRFRTNIARLQVAATVVGGNKLALLRLSNTSSLSRREDLEHHLIILDDEELTTLYTALNFRLSFPDSASRPVDRPFMLESILETFIRRVGVVEEILTSSPFPTEVRFCLSIPISASGGLCILISFNLCSCSRMHQVTLFKEVGIGEPQYGPTKRMALPKAALQYLSLQDFLWRMLVLYRSEAYFGILEDLRRSVEKLKLISRGGNTSFTSSSKMARRVTRISYAQLPPFSAFFLLYMVRAAV